MADSPTSMPALEQQVPMTWADYFRYLVALTVGLVPFFCFMMFFAWVLSGWSDEIDTNSEYLQIVFTFLRIIGVLAVASALGHAVPSLVRGHISLRLSALLTAAALIVPAVLYAFITTGSAVPTLTRALIIVLPVIAIAQSVRLRVAPLRLHVAGKPLPYSGRMQ